MPLLEIPFPNIDPVALRVLGLEFRWYGIAWMLGFLIGLQIQQREARLGRLWLDRQKVGDFLFFGMLATVLGGRLGYVLFYNLDRYLEQPADLFKVWEGGLSFHGGVIGIILVTIWFVRRQRIPLFNLSDAVVLSACPGIFLVRCANFVNGELWGRTTEASIGMVFPDGGPLPRHPSQLYEAVGEGLLLGAVLFLIRTRPIAAIQGRLSAIFLAGYGLIRFVIEFFREPDAQFLDPGETHGFVLAGLSMGQLLCIAMILGGCLVWWLAGRVGRPVGPAPSTTN